METSTSTEIYQAASCKWIGISGTKLENIRLYLPSGENLYAIDKIKTKSSKIEAVDGIVCHQVHSHRRDSRYVTKQYCANRLTKDVNVVNGH